MQADLLALIIPVVAIALFGIGFLLLLFKLYVKVEQGRAMIVNTLRKEPEVTFTGRMVIPVIHKAEMMDISVKTIEIDRNGRDGLICSDNIRADIKVAFFVRVNKTRDDVMEVAQTIGCVRASDDQTLEELFAAKFSEALKTVGKQMEFEDLYRKRDIFRDNIIALIGKNLNGYVLEDAAIDYLEQTPINLLDPNNILDAQGIRKITRLTADQNVETNGLKRDEEMKIKKQDVEANEKLLELERQKADAEAKQLREIETVQARELAETEKIASEERLKSEQARIETDELLAVREENKLREVEVAAKNRERAVAIETEKVERVRQLEVIAREKEVDLQRIAKEKALEEEKKAIADVIRTRIVVDKSVAEEEENIKELRIISEADRKKQVRIIEAEAQAQEILVKEIKVAEALEITSKHKAQEKLTMAQADLDAAEKSAESSKLLAEGMQAEEAASGLARVRVKEAEAIALEKYGISEAKVLQEKMQATANGEEQQGMAKVRIKDADASSEEKQALVDVKVKIADAEAIEKQALAESVAIREKFKAEADGLQEKFAAMSQMDEKSRSHEEFRMRLENQLKVELESLSTQQSIASSHANVLSKALADANIDIVGGDGAFLDKFFNAISSGKSIDGFVNKSQVATKVFGDYIEGDANLISDMKDILSGATDNSENIKNLTLTAFLGKLIANNEGENKDKLKSLEKTAKKLGIE
ncbi:MAG: hypothetical protein HON94_09965 [Methylococcales bacterium]|jgi:uncharacterized membrane protein YqiK|nr:hypothetical protein [Methylococcales bacterium]MBT7409897.1 hypothetical protein [Methylococcales bacterium]